MIDTLRADHLGCYGYDRDTSPRIDALAAAGVRAAEATSQSSWTAPSMVSMFLSRDLGADFVRVPESVPTLAERLKEAGYQTVAFQHNVLLDEGNGFERGFDYYAVEPGAEQIRRALMQSARGGPRFLYCHFVEPHDPYRPIAEYDRFAPRPLPDEQRAAFAAYLRETSPSLTAEEIDARVDAAAGEMSRAIALYDGEIRQVDALFGTIVDVIEHQGRLDRTVIVIASDHGECLWQHREALAAQRPDADRGDLKTAFKMTHNSTLFQPLVHVPLIFKGPDVPAGAVIDRPVANLDIVPTVLDLLGLASPDDIDGQSLVPDFRRLAAGEPAKGRDLVYSQTALFRSVRSSRGHKLILPVDESGPDRPLYFRLDTDSGERKPLPFDEDAERLEKNVRQHLRKALLPRDDEDVIDPETAERMRQLGYLDER